MSTTNPFSGTGERVQFARLTYNRLMSCEWVTYADVMADYLGLKSAEELPCPVSKCPHYGELKKGFPNVVEKIKEIVGQNSIDEKGNNRERRFSYVGKDKDDDPLVKLRYTILEKSVEEYRDFCKDSAGFFPISWLEYFFNPTLQKKRNFTDFRLDFALF